MVDLGHGYQMSVYQLLEDKSEGITSDSRGEGQGKHLVKKKGRWISGKYLSEFISHEEGRGIGFRLHVSHMGRSGGVDVVGRKHLR